MPIANDESGDDIELDVLVQEMHDNYEKYAHAKINLSELCKLDQKGGGWIQLEDNAGKVLLSSSYQRTKLSIASRPFTLANEASQVLEDASMQEANRDRLDSEAIDYKMADI